MFAEALQIGFRVRQSVDVIDTQTVDPAIAIPAMKGLVPGAEHLRFFHAEADEAIDSKKAPVVDLAGSQTGIRELIVLAIQRGVATNGGSS